MTLRRTRNRSAPWRAFPWTVLGASWHYRRVAVLAWARHRAVATSAARQAAALAPRTDPAARRLVAVLHAVRADRLDGAERAALGRIERQRRRLLHARDTVSWTGGQPAPAAWVCAIASQPAVGARVLYHCVSAWRPTTALELGTCVGVSAAYQARGQSGVPGAHLITIEGYPDLAAQARTLLHGAGLDDVTCVVGRFENVLPGILAAHTFDYAYIDGHHDGDATLRYFEAIRVHCAPQALIVLDDIDYSAGMDRAWRAIESSDHVAATAALGKLGLAVLR